MLACSHTNPSECGYENVSTFVIFLPSPRASVEQAAITVNKNAIPFDTNPPMTASGIRVGTPAVTTRGLKEPEMHLVGRWIGLVLNSLEDESVLRRVRGEVEALTDRFPLYESRRAAVVRAT